MPSYDIQGKLKVINDIQTFDSGFQKREFVVTTDEKFPQDIKFECVKDKCSLLDGYAVGQNIKVSFNMRGNEYNGKYYTNLTAWRLKLLDATGVSQEVLDAADKAQSAMGGKVIEDDTLPF